MNVPGDSGTCSARPEEADLDKAKVSTGQLAPALCPSHMESRVGLSRSGEEMINPPVSQARPWP